MPPCNIAIDEQPNVGCILFAVCCCVIDVHLGRGINRRDTRDSILKVIFREVRSSSWGKAYEPAGTARRAARGVHLIRPRLYASPIN